MSGINQRQKLLCLMKILLEQTDEDNALTIPELIEKLADMGVEAERKSLYSDLETLELFGLDIQRSRTRTSNYFIGSRDFELAELKLLVDAVQSSKFITEKKTRELISKLKKLTSASQAYRLQRQVHSNRIKTMNDSIYYNVDAIHSAISDDKKISFRYYQWVLDKSPHAEKKLKKDGEAYIISPFALTWDDENYYVVAYYEKYGKISHFRVDKMDRLAILDQSRDGKELFKNFDLGEHLKKTFGMFSGEEFEVKLRFRKDDRLVGAVADRFGKELYISRPDDAHFDITLKVTESPAFWGWLFSFEDDVEILSPLSLREKYKEKLERTLEKER